MGRVLADAVHRFYTYDVKTRNSKCKKCQRIIKGKHSTNLKHHLARLHVADYCVVANLNKENPKMPKVKKEKLGNIQNTIKLCMRLVTVHGHPLSLIADSAFQEIVNLTAEGAKGRVNIEAVTEMVHEQASSIRHIISSQIEHILVCLKLDFATCITQQFIGVNIQYIKNGEIVVRNLAVLEVTSCLKDNLEAVLSDFNINADHIYCVITDSIDAKNITKHIQICDNTDDDDRVMEQEGVSRNSTNEELDDSNIIMKIEAHDEDPLTISFVEMDMDNPNKFIRIEDTKEQTENTSRTKQSPSELFCSDNLDVHSFLPHEGFKIRGLVCPTHTFQLAINNALNEDVNARSTLIMARKIVDTFREPINTTKVKAANLKIPIKDCQMDLTSTYNMLVRLLTFKDFCSSVIDLSPYFWKEVSAIVECLTPANAALTDLQQQNLTIGDFYIIWLNCKGKISTFDHRFAKTLQNAMQARETMLLKNDAVLEALYLDRRLNLMLNDERCELAKVCLKKTYERLTKVTNFTNNVEDDQESKIPPIPSTSGVQLLEDMLANAERSRGIFKTRNAFDACLIEMVCSPRIPLTENIIAYWNSKTVNSEVAMVANTVLAVPTTRISVEKLHSSLNFILDPTRRNLNEKLIRDMLLVRQNCDLLD